MSLPSTRPRTDLRCHAGPFAKPPAKTQGAVCGCRAGNPCSPPRRTRPRSRPSDTVENRVQNAIFIAFGKHGHRVRPCTSSLAGRALLMECRTQERTGRTVLHRPRAVLANSTRAVHCGRQAGPSEHHHDSNTRLRRLQLRCGRASMLPPQAKQCTDDVHECRTRRTRCPASLATGGEGRTGTSIPPPERIWAVRQPHARAVGGPDG
ncbi:hypothetical protein V8D89_015554 [Ganoderma adspersum]